MAAHSFFQSCVNESYRQVGEQALQDNISRFLSAFSRYKGCTGDFVQKYDAAITAVFTIALSLSTIALWVSTKDVAVAARKSAEISERAFAQLEGPLIENSRIELIMLPGVSLPKTAPPTVRIWLKNRGRGPGTILQIAGRFVPLPIAAIPPTPEYGLVSASLLSLGANEESPDPLTFPLEIPAGEGAEEVALFVFGFIRYRGIFGGVTTYGFGYMPNRETGQFDAKGSGVYNYRRYEPNEES